MKKSFYLILMVLAFPAFNQDLSGLDGRISVAESKTLKLIGFNGENQLLANTSSERYIQVAIRSSELYVASLCLCNDQGDIVVLHASAALGQIFYAKEKDSWVTDQKFNWKMREVDMTTSTISLRKSYLERNGWIANTMAMGNVGETEFIIDRQVFGGKLKMALGLMTSAAPESIVAIPADDAGDCANQKLVSGDPEKQYQFETSNWLEIIE